MKWIIAAATISIVVSLVSLIITVVGLEVSQSSLVDSQRAGCQRGIIPRIAQINVSWTEAAANKAEADIFKLVTAPSSKRIVVRLINTREKEASNQLLLAQQNAVLIPANQANQIPEPLRSLAHYDCNAAYPSPSFF